MIIRPVQIGDLSELAQVYRKVFATVGESWTPENALKIVQFYLARSPYLCYLAEHENKIIGAYLTDIKPSEDGLHLVDGDLFVLPEFQNSKVGTRLALTVGKIALKMGATKVDTYTFKKGHQLEWYKSKGFKEVEHLTIISADLKKSIESTEKTI